MLKDSSSGNKVRKNETSGKLNVILRSSQSNNLELNKNLIT